MKRRKWLWWLLAIPVLTVWVIGWYFVRAAVRIRAFAPVAASLPAELDAARKEGLPLDPADLRPTPPVPAELNAAPLYRKIDALWNRNAKANRDADNDALSAVARPAHNETDRSKAREVIQRNTEIVRLAERASILPRCDFQRPYEEGPNMKLPEYGTARTLARFFAARAILESDAGKPEAALADIAAGARIGRHVGEDPIMIAMLVRIAIDAIMDRAYRQVIIAYRDRPDVLRLAARTSAEFGAAPKLIVSLGSDVIMGRVAIQMMRSDQFEDKRFRSIMRAMGEKSSTHAAVVNMMCDAWEARLFSYWRRYHAVLRESGDDLLVQYQRSKTLGDQEMAHDGQPTYELAAILNPVYSHAMATVVGDETLRRLRRVTLDLLTYRLHRHAFPKTLEGLPGRTPDDPFTNHPLLYRLTPKGCIVYSVGENFKDDGGSSEKDKDKHPLDIVVELPN